MVFYLTYVCQLEKNHFKLPCYIENRFWFAFVIRYALIGDKTTISCQLCDHLCRNETPLYGAKTAEVIVRT